MLYSVPDSYQSFSLWFLGIIFELLIAMNTYYIDTISEELHFKTSSRWHIDPGATSSTCSSPVEFGKLTSVVFISSVILQILAIISIKIVEKKKAQLKIYHQPQDQIPEGLSEVLYICHGIGGIVTSGVIGYKGIELLVFQPKKFKYCPHVKIVGIFKFSVLANLILFLWYLSIAGPATQFVISEAYGLKKDNKVK
mmetsp:Transcript_13481/g.16056  ORF Transcript_13481/g.16056 Transcript_13481/m.16056 type:complete len:196 (-) Transcript_13481:237-824(-)